MKIATIGTGMIGGTLAHRFAAAGHYLYLSNRRGADSLKTLVSGIGPNVEATTPEDAAAKAEVVVIAVPLHAVNSLPSAPLAGKVVIDPTNYYPARDGQIAEIDNGSFTSSERNARLLPGARLVKAFNTIHYQQLKDDGLPAGDACRKIVFLAGDDADAKQIVASLVGDVGFDALDVGGLVQGRRLQPDSPLYNRVLTRQEADQLIGSPD